MITRWSSHLSDQKDKDNFGRQIQNAADVLDRLADICEEELHSIEQDDKDFAEGWQYKAAANIGRRDQLNRILKLLDRKD